MSIVHHKTMFGKTIILVLKKKTHTQKLAYFFINQSIVM